MGQKIHPRGLRLGIIDDWDSAWFSKDMKAYAKQVKEDDVIRKHVKSSLKAAMVSKIRIERKADKLGIKIITGRSGMVVGRGGQGLDTLRQELSALTSRKDISIDVMEVLKIDADATLVAESIAGQLERRVSFRRAMKQSIQRAMRAGVGGVKIMIAGRLGGAEIARTEWAKEGRIPLHTFRADIDYGVAEAKTMFGIIGVKVWLFKGEVMPGQARISNVKARSAGADDAGAGGGGESRRDGGNRGDGRRSGGPGGQGGRDGGRPPGGGGGGRRRSAPVTVSQLDPKPEA